MAKKVNLEQLARTITVPYAPVTVAEVDEYHAFIVLFEGTFPWHDHRQDELFIVLDGELRVEFKGGLTATTLGPQDSLLIRSGTVHQTVAPRRARALVFEKRSVTRETLKDR
jgi:mannose-6-phosphate isomerase-like protein (cupin superfamily)